MGHSQDLLFFLSGFILISMAAFQTGELFARWKLPMISGYLITGVIAGAFVLGFISHEATEELIFIDEFSLAFIAFAAGSELYLPEIRGRLKSIGWVTGGLVITTFLFVSTTVFFLSDYIPFVQHMNPSERLAVSILAGAIMVARSPSSAIAIVNELRARGPFTQVVLGVTVIMDVVVIIVFAINASIADALLTEIGINLTFILLLIGELILAFLLAFLLFQFIHLVLARKLNRAVKTTLILASGFSVFLLSTFIRETTHSYGTEILIEPLLICMVASFLVNNYSTNRHEFASIISQVGPFIFVAFFTLTGASLELDVFLRTWPIALALFGVRLVAIIIGSFTGGMLAGDNIHYNRLKWMGFVTQAGVALGLAKDVAVEFPELGNAFATMIISVVVLNEMIGPIFFKFAINRVGEAHTKAPSGTFDGVRDVIIFGMKPQAVSLARQLRQHDWEVKLVCTTIDAMQELAEPGINVCVVENFTRESLAEVNAAQADAIVSLLSDDLSYEICQLIYEHFGIDTMVVQLNNRANFARFHELGVKVVEPQTAVIALLEHYVRSPMGTALLLGTGDDQEVVDIVVRNPHMHQVALRELQLPLDVLILSIHRSGQPLVTRGYTRLNQGDKVTMVGPEDKLGEVMLRFDSPDPWQPQSPDWST